MMTQGEGNLGSPYGLPPLPPPLAKRKEDTLSVEQKAKGAVVTLKAGLRLLVKGSPSALWDIFKRLRYYKALCIEKQSSCQYNPSMESAQPSDLMLNLKHLGSLVGSPLLSPCQVSLQNGKRPNFIGISNGLQIPK